MFKNIYEQVVNDSVNLTAAIIAIVVMTAGFIYVVWAPRMFLLGLKNLRRNFLRTMLTGVAIGVLRWVVCAVVNAPLGITSSLSAVSGLLAEPVTSWQLISRIASNTTRRDVSVSGWASAPRMSPSALNSPTRPPTSFNT